MGVGAERWYVLPELNPPLPNDLPPPARAKTIVSITIKKVKRSAKTERMRFRAKTTTAAEAIVMVAKK